MECINSLEEPLYKKFIGQQGVKNLTFEIHDIKEEKHDDGTDIWVIFNPDPKLMFSYSLNNLMWKITCDNHNFMKNFKVEHGLFYELLQSETGKSNLAYLVSQICYLLKKVSDIGATYGNLRLENIIITLDK